MSKPVILTGLRANNDLHIGNYFGALLPLVDMTKTRSDEFEVNLFVPDLHSFTTPIDHSQLQAQILHNLKLFVAAGLPLDNPNIHIYRQSHIPAHSELTWILDCFTGFGEMRRMTQFKDKSGSSANYAKFQEASKAYEAAINDMGSFDANKSEMTAEIGKKTITLMKSLNEVSERMRKVYEVDDNTTVGLFNYPVLMAADILLYGAKYIPVGDDQSQHLEFARDISERLNNRFGELFIVPEPVKKQHEFFGKEQGLRIKDLQDPTKKMSKSDESGKGIIFLGDAPESAARKIKSAATDSYGKIDPVANQQPGIVNLIEILALVEGKSRSEILEKYHGQEQYGPLKTDVAEAVSAFLGEFQTRLAQVDEVQLRAKLEADEKQMNEVANATLLKVQKAVGLRA